MIEYAKVILPKVCFWESLFKKELLKCIHWTEYNEMNELISWCYNTFGEMHPEILHQAFTNFKFERKSHTSSSYSVNSHKVQIKNTMVVEAA